MEYTVRVMNNETKTYTGIRFQVIGSQLNLNSRLKHNLREVKVADRVKEVPNLLLNGEKWGLIKPVSSGTVKEKFGGAYSSNLIKMVNLRTAAGGFIHKARTSALYEGIIYFSSAVKEDYEANKKEFVKRVGQTLKDVSTATNASILNAIIHVDEEGSPHCHFISSNYNKDTGKPLQLKKNFGSTFQSIAGKNFKDFGKGYERGEIGSKKSHLSVYEYKKQMAAIKEVEDTVKREKEKARKAFKEALELRKERKALEEEMEALREAREASKREAEEIATANLLLKQELIQEFSKVVKELEGLTKTSNFAEWEGLISTYNEGGRIVKLKRKMERLQKKINLR